MAKFHSFHPNCTLPDEVPVGFVNAPNIRTTMQIVWSCFSVILLCTWSILHPNVPPELKPKGKRQKVYKKLFLLFRKVFWMGVMLIAPEFLTTFTTKKMLGTKKNVKALKDYEVEDGVCWDLPQTILADMGGIVIYFPDDDSQGSNEKSVSESSLENRSGQETPRSSQEDLISNQEDLIPNQENSGPDQEAVGSIQGDLRSSQDDSRSNQENARSSQEDARSDQESLRPSQEALRSPTDLESQISTDHFIETFMKKQNWWLGGCEIPWKRHEPHLKHAEKARNELDKTSLEWKIQNIAALSGNVWTLDSKQLAIARRHGIIKKLPNIKVADIDDKNKSDALVKLLAVIQVVWMVFQLCARVYYHLPFAPLELSTVAFSATAIILYSIEWEKPKDVITPVYVPAHKSSVSPAAFEDIVEAAPFPYMQIPYMQCKHYYMPSVAFHETDGDLRHIDGKSFVVALITVVSFGGIHLLAWNLQFPTPIEGLIWKISAIMTIACPTLYCSSHLPFMGQSPKHVGTGTALKVKAVVLFTSFFYIFARLFLITESIRSLYYLPRETFISTWTADIPHMS